MRKKIILLIFIVLMVFSFILIVGHVTSMDKNVKAQKTDIMEDQNNEAADSFMNSPESLRLGAFSFGIISSSDDRQVYVYDGEELHIPYRVEGLDETVRSDFGLMVFVDGIVQPYKINYKDGRITEEQYLHKFYLYNKEMYEFDIVFTPTTGKEGERLGVVFATILNPDFMPEDGNYGIYHAISANTPQEIYFNTTPNVKNLKVCNEYTMYDIPQDRIDRLSFFTSGSEYNPIDSNFITEITVNGEQVTNIDAHSGKVKFTFSIYGGLEAVYRTIFFINHEPIKIKDADYLDIKTEKGMMCSVDLEIEMTGMEKLSTLYAITNPTGKDYLSDISFPVKSKSVLLINDSVK